MRLFLRASGPLLGAVVAAWVAPACYNAGNGTQPPTNTFYFPTGLAVSTGGNVLYAANSDFDLQYNGGTLQSYDLFQIRWDAAELIKANTTPGNTQPPPGVPFLAPYQWAPDCEASPPPPASNGNGVYLGQACAPPVDSTYYVRDSAIIGAFATDLQLSVVGGTRLFMPVAGNATVTWGDVAADDPGTQPPSAGDASSFAPFAIDCGTRVDGRCYDSHQTGNDPDSPFNTRQTTMPGQPFGMAQTQDGSALTVTSETDTKTSVLTTGLGASSMLASYPTMQFVVDGLPNGGVGLAAVPHDEATGIVRCETHGDAPGCVRPAFLETFRGASEIDLLRYYDDDGSSLHRPFLQKEVAYPINTGSGSPDARGIAIDWTPRLKCELTPGLTPQQVQDCVRQTPARVFIANRGPESIIVGTIGAVLLDGTYDPDALTLLGNVPLPPGSAPSNIYVAPVVDPNGYYQVRVFVVGFGSNQIYVFDPDDLQSLLLNPLATITVGPGPYALAFDPFDWTDAMTKTLAGEPVPKDPRYQDVTMHRYRFGYVASFTQSFVQVIDLDETTTTGKTHSVVYTLGQPTLPKGQ